MRSGIFDVEVLVLASSAFRGQHAATVDIREITIGKFIPSLGALLLLIVDPEEPFCVLPESMSCQKLIFRLRRWEMFAPIIPFVEYRRPGENKLLGKVECRLIQFHHHGTTSRLGPALSGPAATQTESCVNA